MSFAVEGWEGQIGSSGLKGESEMLEYGQGFPRCNDMICSDTG